MGPVPRRISIPRPHKAFGLCALGFTQFKADGLVQTYGLPTHNHDLATRNHSYDLATSKHSYDLATRNHTPTASQPSPTLLRPRNPHPHSFPLFF